MAYVLRILHISDLHERVSLDWMSPERKRKIRVRASSRHRVLEDSNIYQLLAGLARERPFDLVCLTGDVADWGLQQEYVLATSRIDAILQASEARREQLYLVPGNHDVNRTEHAESWNRLREFASEYSTALGDWLAGLETPPGADATWLSTINARKQAYWSWVANDLGRDELLPDRGPHGRLGYRTSTQVRDFPFPVHLFGLDTSWLSGDNHDARKLRLTEQQIDLLTRDDDGKALPGFRIALMHHPFGDLADEHASIERLSRTTDILLHGHQHDPIAELRSDPDRSLRVFAAGSLYEGDQGDRWINSFQTIDVELDIKGRPERYNVHFFGWSPKGHWHPAGSIYRSAPHGTLTINVNAPVVSVARPVAPSAAPALRTVELRFSGALTVDPVSLVMLIEAAKDSASLLKFAWHPSLLELRRQLQSLMDDAQGSSPDSAFAGVARDRVAEFVKWGISAIRDAERLMAGADNGLRSIADGERDYYGGIMPESLENYALLISLEIGIPLARAMSYLPIRNDDLLGPWLPYLSHGHRSLQLKQLFRSDYEVWAAKLYKVSSYELKPPEYFYGRKHDILEVARKHGPVQIAANAWFYKWIIPQLEVLRAKSGDTTPIKYDERVEMAYKIMNEEFQETSDWS